MAFRSCSGGKRIGSWGKNCHFSTLQEAKNDLIQKIFSDLHFFLFQQIRLEQDAALQESLRQDQEKERKKREEEEKKRKEASLTLLRKGEREVA